MWATLENIYVYMILCIAWTQRMNNKRAQWTIQQCVTQEEHNVSYLKNSFFSSSVFKVRLFRKFFTSRKSFLFTERKTVLWKPIISSMHWGQQQQTWSEKQTNLKKSWVSKELSGGRDKGSELSRPACRVFFRLSDSSCDTGNDKGRSVYDTGKMQDVR